MTYLSRRVALGAMGGGLMLGLTGRAWSADYVLTPERIADGIWIIRGADAPIGPDNGGAVANIGIIASEEGTILVDCGPSRRYGEALRRTAEALTGKPVIRVYVTHLHPDHSFGLGAFDPAREAALPETITELERDGPGFSDGMYRILNDWMRGTEVVIPTVRLSGGEEHFGSRRLEVIPLAGHSGGDLALMDKASGVLFAGDLVFHNRAPATPDADLAVWRKSLDALAALPHGGLVPGHGPYDAGGQAAIAQTRDWLNWLEAAIDDAVRRGLSPAEAGELPIPPHFAGMAASRYEFQRSVVHFYGKADAAELPRIDTP